MHSENPLKLTPKLLKRFRQFKRLTDKDSTKMFQAIIELGKKLAPMPEELKIEENLVRGCTSVTHIAGKKEGNTIHYQGDSNSMLVKGLVALLIEGMDQEKPEDIINVDPKFMQEMGLSQTLTASRANGFMNTFAMMVKIAQKELNE